MSEDRYVVRDKDGVLVTVADDAVTFHHNRPMARSVALPKKQAIAALRHARSEVPQFAPYKLYRLTGISNAQAERDRAVELLRRIEHHARDTCGEAPLPADMVNDVWEFVDACDLHKLQSRGAFDHLALAAPETTPNSAAEEDGG